MQGFAALVRIKLGSVGNTRHGAKRLLLSPPLGIAGICIFPLIFLFCSTLLYCLCYY
ncbi:Protein of unknown function [Pyronema omphalodes CBS 100304]|uniref:Uncharacterized protein n=1 Tax=Pyronema omphalodes (strain CBS 100304) TaxID=1076935 RepID=U4L3W4_PYROM|nr:Protein of unknown function [Pyronema omphalodes CBS 100304]